MLGDRQRQVPVGGLRHGRFDLDPVGVLRGGRVEQPRREVGQRVLPGVPAVRALEPAVELVRHTQPVEGLHRVDHATVGEVGDVAVVQPQQRGALVDRCHVQVGPVARVGGGERADVGKLTWLLGQNSHSVPAAHGQAGKGSLLRVVAHVEL